MKPLLEIQGLETQFEVFRGVVKAVEDVSFSMDKGETVGLVGESGSGKSVTALSIMGLIKKPGKITAGRILFEGEDLLSKTGSELNSMRGRKFSMCFQNPKSALNPVISVGEQIMRVYSQHSGASPAQAKQRAVELLKLVNIAEPESVMKSFPHQLSGGMCQRVMLVLALVCYPELIILDEPTTGLDVTIQNQVLRLLRRVQRSTGCAQLLITHDLGVAAQTCERILVMYGGRIVEATGRKEFFESPHHPYSQALIKSILRIGDKGSVRAIPGSVPNPRRKPPGCAFHPRCDKAVDRCSNEVPAPVQLKSGHSVVCHLYGPRGEGDI